MRHYFNKKKFFNIFKKKTGLFIDYCSSEKNINTGPSTLPQQQVVYMEFAKSLACVPTWSTWQRACVSAWFTRQHANIQS